MNNSFVIGTTSVEGNTIPRISTELKPADFRGSVMVRWGFNRDNYKITPGLYSVGAPGQESDVFVTANYKLTFDHVRKNLSGMDCWILVLDTKGINVWCAAGKGIFGTKELVNRIRLVSLEKIVSHRRLILPQLGATGVAAHLVKQETGFNVHYGPVLAEDIRRFISEGYRADKEMRKVRFGFTDRIRLIPNDFMYGKYYLLGAILILLLLSGISKTGISYNRLPEEGGPIVLGVFLAYLAGIVITPMFLPYIPGRHFSLKGLFSGSLAFLIFLMLASTGYNPLLKISWFFIMGAISSFLAMNFTGSSTFTSLSGVKKEMKLFVPVQICSLIIGIILYVTGKLI